MDNTPLIGHTKICQQLNRIARLSEIPQSFLFTGPKHVGKRRVAWWFAHQLIRDESQATVFSPDILLIEPEQVATAKQMREKLISVEAIRSFKQFLSRSPSFQSYRIGIIDRAEKLSQAATDALLKILEEPPRQSIIILLTSEPEHLPETLRSRTVRFGFSPVSAEDIRSVLTDSTVQSLPQFFFDLGLPGLIIEASQSPQDFDDMKECLRKLFQISKIPLRKRIELAESLAKDEIKTRDILQIWSIGLLFQARQGEGSQMTARYTLLQDLLEVLKFLSRNEGSPRSILEKLLTNCP